MKNNKIFIIEDNISIQELFEIMLAPYGQIIQAFTLAEAEAKFAGEKNITHILVDANLNQRRPDGKPETTDLVIKMRETFTGPMIAISSDEAHNKFLKTQGCSHAVYKSDSLKFVINLLEQES